MSELKLTKTELRVQQVRLTQLEKYLPTLQLKKALLQIEVQGARSEMQQLEKQMNFLYEEIKQYEALFSAHETRDLIQAVTVREVRTKYDNIAGIELPIFESIIFEEPEYALFDTPVWLDASVGGVKQLIGTQQQLKIVAEKRRLLEKELREVSIRVNLFEKILIPRAMDNIKKIKIFLGDLQMSAVAQAKVAKQKILQRKEKRE